MAALADNKPRGFSRTDPNPALLPVGAGSHIYAGAALMWDDTNNVVDPAVGTAGTEIFMGFAEEEADNSAGADAAISVRVIQTGIVQVTAMGGTPANSWDDVGKTVYMSTDNDFTFTSTNNMVTGKCVGYYDATWHVYFEAAYMRSI